MKIFVHIVFACCVIQLGIAPVVAQEPSPNRLAESWKTSGATKSVTADGVDRNNSSPSLTGERRPHYRICKSDVITVSFAFASELDQTVTVQPDGFIALKGVEEIYAEDATVPELRTAIIHAYASILHDPEVTLTLKDFDKPSFVAAGQVAHPGKFELRSDTTVTEAVAIAGGFTDQARHSQVVLFRRESDQMFEARLLDVKALMKSRNLGEDIHLKPGDIIFVPQNRISKIRKFLPVSNLSAYMSPSQF
jgi:protein involved in polysaccharide export with SLBB domain